MLNFYYLGLIQPALVVRLALSYFEAFCIKGMVIVARISRPLRKTPSLARNKKQHLVFEQYSFFYPVSFKCHHRCPVMGDFPFVFQRYSIESTFSSDVLSVWTISSAFHRIVTNITLIGELLKGSCNSLGINWYPTWSFAMWWRRRTQLIGSRY